jgi:AcrR family transcriptional regulator
MAPNWGGQFRMQTSQLMQIDMSMRSGGSFHFGLRSRVASRSALVLAPAPATVRAYRPPPPTLTRRSSGGELRGMALTADRHHTIQGQERKQQLLDCAATLFAERGYADTRVADIMRAAGVAKGLFYWYFENKEALFRELADSIRLRLRRYQAAAMDPGADPLVRIRQGTEASVRFMATYARFFALLEVENLDKRFVDVLRQGTDVHVADVARLVQEGIAAGLIRDEDPVLLARGIVGVVGSYSHFHRTGRSDLPIDALAAFVGRFVVCSLAADEDIARRVLSVPRQPVVSLV